MTFPEKMLGLRKQKNLSQEALAEKLDVSRQAVSRWESGTAMPDAVNLLQLGRLFAVSIDYLLDDDMIHPMSAPTLSHKNKHLQIWGISACAGGSIGWAVILILSTMIEVPVGRDIVYENGWTSYETFPGYHLPTFLNEYRLYALCAVFTLLIIAGITLLLIHNTRQKEAETK